MNSRKPVNRAGVIIKTSSLALSILLVLSLSFAYALQPDALAAITFLPVWVWAAPGLVLAAVGFSKRRKWLTIGVIALWLVYLGVFAEEPWSLLRHPRVDNPTWQAARFEGRGIRVVSLNCGSEETVEAADEVASHLPDIVLLEEAPDLPAIRRLAKRLYGDAATIAYFPDRAIIAHGVINEIRHVRGGGLLRARVKLASGPELEVFCLHLISPTRRHNVFAPANFRLQTQGRRARREQMEVVAQEMAGVPDDMPLLVGGDCNAGQNDAVYRLLQPRLSNTFKEAGIGWGNTILNDLPILRIDQLWVNRQLEPVAVYTYKTRHSDHRMVVCDLVWRG